MSDLISRKKIRDYIKGEINPYGKQFEGTAYELGLKIIRYIDAMDSDYDVENVVEELEENSSRYTKKYTTPYGNNGYKDIKAISIRKAIEIVKQGGVTDDVCEWKQDNMCEKVYMVCGGCFTSAYQKDFKFCPYCGKKIKIVGDWLMNEEDFFYCHNDDTDEYHDCLDYMECEECPYYYADLD